MTTQLYGIKNCDTVKKAKKWLENHDINYKFCDFREDGFTSEEAASWLLTLGAETLINKRSTTWKSLNDRERDLAFSAEASHLLVDQPTLIKRPLLIHNGDLYVGFKPDNYAKIFAK